MRCFRIAALLFVSLAHVARAGDTQPSDTIVTISVPGHDIITTSDFSGPPDDGGGFDFGVLTAATKIQTSACDKPTNYLNVTVGDTEPTGNAVDLTADQKALVARKNSFYRYLLSKENTDDEVVLHIKTPRHLLYMKNGHLYAPQCAVALDTEALDHD